MKPDMSPDTVNTRPLDRAPDLVTNGQMRVWAARCAEAAGLANQAPTDIPDVVLVFYPQEAEDA